MIRVLHFIVERAVLNVALCQLQNALNEGRILSKAINSRITAEADPRLVLSVSRVRILPR